MAERFAVNEKVVGSSPTGGAQMKITVSWLTIISFVLNLFLAGLGVFQYFDATKKEESARVMIRSWQNSIEGINNGLLAISQNPNYFTSKEDIAMSVGVAAQSTRALNDAMLQQRFYSDDQVRIQKEKSAEETRKLIESFRDNAQQSATSSPPTK